MASSQVDICNIALLKITRTTITSIDGSEFEAIVCKQMFDHIRDLLLRSHFWNFAKKRQTLQKLTSTPAFEYDNEYDLPADYIRAVRLHGGTTTASESSKFRFKVEGSKLLTDDSTANLVYISKVTDPTQFDPLFVETMATLLAAELSRPITGSETYRKELLIEVKTKLAEAKRRDGQEDTPDNLITETFTDARRSSTFEASWDLGT